MTCFFCQGPAHPATGHQYTPTCISCYRCTREFWAWVKGHTNKKARRKRGSGIETALSFYEHAGRK